MRLFSHGCFKQAGVAVLSDVLMLCHCAVTGHNGELRVKQEAQADFAAMSRDHVTEEDIETFTHVQERAVQVRKLGKGLNILNILNINWNFRLN